MFCLRQPWEFKQKVAKVAKVAKGLHIPSPAPMVCLMAILVNCPPVIR
jgi:hypothetical protein